MKKYKWIINLNKFFNNNLYKNKNEKKSNIFYKLKVTYTSFNFFIS